MDIVTLAAVRKGGGSGGDVTKQYVDDHLALKADKSETAEYPIADSVFGINPTITDSANGYVQNMTVYGRSRTSKNLFGGVYGEIYDFANVIPASTSVAISFIRTAGDAGGAVTVSFYEKNSDTRYDYFTISGTNRVVTLVNDTGRVLFTAANAEISNIQIKLGSVPTPYEPYGIISIGDSGSLTITTANSDSSESSTATLTTGLPYCGIPVNSGETYTDGNGVKWLADTAGVEGVTTRCGVIEDLSQLDWTFRDDWQVFTVLISNAKKYGNGLVSSEYLTFQTNTPLIESGIMFNAANRLICSIAEYKDPVDINGFKAAIAGIKLIYELAEPTTTPLTTAEKSALRNLRTYNPTTNVTVTDNPTVDIGYLLNTANGQAVADVQTAIQQLITGALEAEY